MKYEENRPMIAWLVSLGYTNPSGGFVAKKIKEYREYASSC